MNNKNPLRQAKFFFFFYFTHFACNTPDCVCVFYKSGHIHCNAFACIFFESTACILSRSGVVYICFFFLLSVAYYLDPTEIDSCDDTNELYLKGKWIFCDTGSQLLLHHLFHFFTLVSVYFVHTVTITITVTVAVILFFLVL